MDSKTIWEYGITPLVKTIYASYRFSDIIEGIVKRKEVAVLNWMKNEEKNPESCLITGAYLTGAKLANTLAKVSQVMVYDNNPLMKELLDPGVSFTTDFHDLAERRWEIIIDTTGLGGINPDLFTAIPPPDRFLIEDPCSDASDITIIQNNNCFSFISRIKADRKGILHTGGLNTKTSGTMTLMMEVVWRSILDSKQMSGVLYSTSCLDHFERYLFREADYNRFVSCLNQPALIVSTLEDICCDEIINANLCAIRSQVNDFPGEFE